MQSKIKQFDTKKLFYKRWLNKLVVECEGIAHLHRRGIKWVSEVHPMSPNRWGATPGYTQRVVANRDSLLQVGASLEVLLKDKQYQLRAEGDRLCIFTNDEDLLVAVTEELENFVVELHCPNNDADAKFMIENKYKVICKELPHENYRYKIYFKNGNSPDQQTMDGFLKWSEKFKDGRILIPQSVQRILSGDSHGYFYGHYFYAKDSSMASMALLFMGDYLNKTEEFVLKSEVNA